VQEFLAIKTASGFLPLEAQDREAYDQLRFGVPIRVKATVARSKPRNRWFHACLNALFEQQETWPTRTLFRNAIKQALGLVIVYHVKGKDYYEYPSLAFDKMSESDFSEFCDRFVRLVCERIIPQMLDQEARLMLDLVNASKGERAQQMIEQSQRYGGR